jgi:hypothetical protein
MIAYGSNEGSTATIWTFDRGSRSLLFKMSVTSHTKSYETGRMQHVAREKSSCLNLNFGPSRCDSPVETETLLHGRRKRGLPAFR